MEPWVKVLLEVTKPVLKTLVCAGTSSFLETVRDEIKNEQRHQTQSLMDSLGIKDQTVSELQNFIDNFAFLGELANSSEKESQLEQERWLQQQLVSQNLATFYQLSAQAQETTLQIPEIQKTLDHWPLRLLPAQLLKSSHPDGLIPLRILMALPKVPLAGFESMDLGTGEIEHSVAQTLREFLEQNYSLHDPVKPTEFLAGAWNSEYFQGESSIKILFSLLESVPTSILESAFEGDYLNFRLAYWGGQAKNYYYYKTILKLPYKEFIAESAKVRALKWKTIRDKLLALGKTTAEINRLGGDNAINLALMEEAETLQSIGINSRELTFSYQLNQKDLEALCQLVSICHCIVAGWMSELHYGISDRAPLHFSNWLPQLTQVIAERKTCQTLIQNLITTCQDIGQAYAPENPRYLPELALQLAQSLTHLADKSLAQEQVSYSLQLWLNLHQLSQLDEIQQLEKIPSTITGEDLNYLATLKTCWSALGEEGKVAKLEKILEAIPCSIEGQRNFILGHTLTSNCDIASLAIAPDGKKIVSSGDYRTLELWHLEQKSRKLSVSQKLSQHSGEVLTFALSPNGQTLVSSEKTEQRSYIKVWNLPTGKLHQTLFGHKQAIRSLAISPWHQGSDRFFVASGSHKIKLWDLETGESCQTLFGHRAWVRSLAISADAKFLISGSEDRSVRIWHLSTGKLMRTLTGHQGCVRSLAITPDGETLVSGSDDGTLKLWRVKTGKLLHTYRGHSKAIAAVAISPNCEYLISGSEDKTIGIWHLATGKLLQTLRGHQEAVRAIAISPDGQTLVSGSSDKTIRIWQTSQELLVS